MQEENSGQYESLTSLIGNLAGSARGKRRQKLYLSLTEAVLWQDLRERRLGDLIP